MNDVRDVVFRKNAPHSLQVGDVCLDKLIIGLVLDIPQVFQITRIGQRIQIINPIVRKTTYKSANHMRTDKSGSSGNEYISVHVFQCLMIFLNINRIRWASNRDLTELITVCNPLQVLSVSTF